MTVQYFFFLACNQVFRDINFWGNDIFKTENVQSIEICANICKDTYSLTWHNQDNPASPYDCYCKDGTQNQITDPNTESSKDFFKLSTAKNFVSRKMTYRVNCLSDVRCRLSVSFFPPRILNILICLHF